MVRGSASSKTMPQKGPPRRPETNATRWVREKVIAQRDAAIKARSTPNGDVIRRAVAKEIRDALAGSDPTERDRATLISAIALDQYILSTAGDILRSDRIEGVVDCNGDIQTTDVPRRLSIPPRDANGARVKKAGSYPMWLSLPRKEYFAKLADIDLAYAKDGLRRALWHKGAEYLNKYPQATDVVHALRLARVSVERFLATP